MRGFEARGARAPEDGLKEKAEEFRKTGAEIYRKPNS